LIEVALRRDRFAFSRFDGEMSVKKKAAAVEEFTRPSRSGKVFIVSLKAGGVGLNVRVFNTWLYDADGVACTGS
jgi:DNA repair protein RAD5